MYYKQRKLLILDKLMEFAVSGSGMTTSSLSQSRLARITGMSRSSVHRTLKQLDIEGVISTQKKWGFQSIFLLHSPAGGTKK